MPEFRTLTEIVKKARQNLDQGSWDYLVGVRDKVIAAAIRKVWNPGCSDQVLNDVTISYSTGC